jgi:hypothetical protein
MKTRTHFAHRIEMWTNDGEKVIEHIAGVEDFVVATATYKAACERWPGTSITLRQGARDRRQPPDADGVSVTQEGRGFVLVLPRCLRPQSSK